MTTHQKLSETINTDNANFLLNLTDDEFEALIWREETKYNKGEPFKPKAVYIKQAKSWLKQHLEHDGQPIDIKYNFSKKMKDAGRLFTNNFSLQTCKKNLRGFLAQDSELDYDMINAHPSILKFVLSTFYNCNVEAQFPTFFNFLSNRDNFLEISGLQKNDVLTMMNSAKIFGNANIHAQNIDLEFKLIQSMVYNNLPAELEQYGKYKYLDSNKNKCGKFLNKLLCIFENAIINQVMEYYADKYDVTPVSSIIFDGLHISSKLDDQTDILNEITKIYGVKWSIKEFDTSITEHELYINRTANPPPYKGDGYDEVKREFEKSHFMTKNPICFFAEDEKGYSGYNVGDFSILTAPYQYMSYSRGYAEQQSIFSKWTRDVNRRVYKNIDFIPSLSYPNNVYNTFQGFKYADYELRDFEYKSSAVEMFVKQIAIIVNHEPHVVDYFIKYFAHLFQKSLDLPGVCLVLKSREGWGKDMLVATLEKLIGTDYTCRTGNMDSVFGTFNASIKDKLLIQLNELGGRDGFANKDKLKDLITATSISINDKNMKSYNQSNYARWIVATNNLTPIEVKADSRRFVIVSADPIKPSTEYFKDYWEMIGDDDSLCSIFQFLMEVDLSEFDVRAIPQTRIAKSMKTSNTPPIYTFLKHYFEADLYQEAFLNEYQPYKKNKFAFNITNFKNIYYTFCVEEDLSYLNIPIKVVYALLNEINIVKKQISIDGVTRKALLIDVDALRIALVNLVVEEVEDDE